MRRIQSIDARATRSCKLMVTIAVLMLLGAVAYSMLMNSTTLLAKNVSLNSSNILARASLDRIFAELNQANKTPTLINCRWLGCERIGSGRGYLFDKYVGGPYVVGNPARGWPQQLRLSTYTTQSIRQRIRQFRRKTTSSSWMALRERWFLPAAHRLLPWPHPLLPRLPLRRMAAW